MSPVRVVIVEGIVVELRVRDYLDKARSTSKELFLTEFQKPFLVATGGETHESKEDFFTETIDADKLAQLAAESSQSLDLDATVYRVVKRKGANPFAGMITVGRAKNCDIVIASRRISKFHCFISVDDGDANRFRVADGGSRNGTLLNGERLAKNQPTPLFSGDRIELGAAVSFVFLSPEEFYQKLGL
jgi:hypothetical protein